MLAAARRLRRLSTRVEAARPLQRAVEADKKQPSATKAHGDSDTSPFSHFGVFGSMDDYVDATLIQYQNDSEADKEPEEA